MAADQRNWKIGKDVRQTCFFFNVPEHRNPRAEDNKMQDMEYIQIFESSLGLENIQMITFFRVGKKSLTLNRPLKLVLMKSQKNPNR